MEIHQNFNKKFGYISNFNGVGLNIEERLRLEISLNELHQSSNAEEVLFWGKIIGIKYDYFIAILVVYKGNYEFPEKMFYYTNSTTWKFNKLPDIKKYHIEDNEIFHILQFTGEPSTILKTYENEEAAVNSSMDGGNKEPEKEVNPNPLDISDSEDNKIVKEEKKSNFTELEKLSFIVKIIEYETHIFPQGALMLNSIHELRRNDNFKGLKKEDLVDIRKYSHFRRPSQLEKIEKIESEEAIFYEDILDDLNKDEVKSK